MPSSLFGAQFLQSVVCRRQHRDSPASVLHIASQVANLAVTGVLQRKVPLTPPAKELRPSFRPLNARVCHDD